MITNTQDVLQEDRLIIIANSLKDLDYQYFQDFMYQFAKDNWNIVKKYFHQR